MLEIICLKWKIDGKDKYKKVEVVVNMEKEMNTKRKNKLNELGWV